MFKKAMMGPNCLDQHIDNCRAITITTDIMKSLVYVSLSVCCSIYEATLFKATSTTAFYDYFRIWKLFGSNLITGVCHAFQLQGITFSANSKSSAIYLSIRVREGRVS